MKHAAIYVRRSVAEKDQRAASLETQEADCCARAEELGYEPEVFTEERSASEYGNGRPVWDDLMRRLDQFAIVLAWRQDRLARDELEWHQFVRAAGRFGTRVITIADGTDIDPDSPDLLAPSVRAAVAAQESRNTSQRVRRGLAKSKADGRPAGGLRRYGYTRVDHSLQIVPEEQAVLVDAARKVLAGASVRSVVRDLNERRVPTVTGKKWSVGSLHGILSGSTINGRRLPTSEPRWEAAA